MTDNNIHRANKRGMVLAIDMGNTNIVIGCIDDDKVYFEERLATDLKKTELEYVVLIKTVLELYGIDSSQISGAIISSVVPQLVNIIREAVEKLIDITPMVVGPGVKTGLNIHMDEPRRVGSDLIVDAVAAIKEYGAPVWVQRQQFRLLMIKAAMSAESFFREYVYRLMHLHQEQHSSRV